MNDFHAGIAYFEAREEIMVCAIEHDGFLSAGDGKTRKNPPISFEMKRIPIGATLVENRVATSTENNGVHLGTIRSWCDVELTVVGPIHQVDFRARRGVGERVFQRICIGHFDRVRRGKIARIRRVCRSARAARTAGSCGTARAAARCIATCVSTCTSSGAAGADIIAGLTAASRIAGAAGTTEKGKANARGRRDERSADETNT